MTTLTIDVLETLRQRRTAGESVKALAAGLGLTWQKLDKAIRNGLPAGLTRKPDPPAGQAQEASPAIPMPSEKAGPLTERYRPKVLDHVWGQPNVVRALKTFTSEPYPAAFILQGETGTGKTSAALALAAELGCRVDQAEYGGVWQIASGEQTADAVREIARRMWVSPLMGSGWKTVIVNECDRMARPAEMIWLDVLENLPRRTVVIFTTNDAANLSQRFRDRCVRLTFESDAAKLRRPAEELFKAVWRRETGTACRAAVAERIVDGAVEGDKLSFRRIIQATQQALLTEPRVSAAGRLK
jgi:replication-associated recombination protein RarA